MSQRNINSHSIMIAAVNAREVPTDILAPEFSMENRTSAVTDYAYNGATGWRDWMDDVFEEFTAEARYELEEIVAAADDFVVAMLRIVGRGARSGTPLEFRWTGVTWFRDGKATRAVGYSTCNEALEAAGILPRAEVNSRRRTSPSNLCDAVALTTQERNTFRLTGLGSRLAS